MLTSSWECKEITSPSSDECPNPDRKALLDPPEHPETKAHVANPAHKVHPEIRAPVDHRHHYLRLLVRQHSACNSKAIPTTLWRSTLDHTRIPDKASATAKQSRRR